MKYRVSKISIAAVVVAIILAALAFKYIKDTSSPEPLEDRLNDLFTKPFTNSNSNNSGNPANTNDAGETAIPATHLLKVPFTPQAPTANWDELHNEACEEASSIMAAAYFSGDTRTTLPASEVEKQISDLTKWQDDHFGYHLNTTAQETAQMIEDFYHLHTKLVNDFTEDNIKRELAAGNIVIVPENGQLLGNPNYKQPGPIYHMLVMRGYTPTQLITNDSGTRKGENYSYSFSTIKNAAADWDHSKNTVDRNKKVMIVVFK